MAKELSCVYDADPRVVSKFLSKAFAAVDQDQDTDITFEEFMEGSRHVCAAMMSGFFRGSGYKQRAARSRALASRSYRTSLHGVATSAAKSVSEVTSRRGSRLPLDANPASSHGVEVRLDVQVHAHVDCACPRTRTAV